MAIPEYDNAAKWAVSIRSLPLMQKVIIIVIAVFIMWIGLYFWLGPMRTLQKDNSQLKTDLSEAQNKIASLKDKKDELHRENLYYKNIVEPLQRKAAELYPRLKVDAALEKLSENLATVRSLATRDVYKPLNKSLRDDLVQNLIDIYKHHTNPPKFIISVEQGNSSRMRIGKDLTSFINSAGFTTSQRSKQTLYVGIVVPSDITIKYNPLNLKLVQAFANIIGKLYINTQFANNRNEKFDKEEIIIDIKGDPLFSESGIVTF